MEFHGHERERKLMEAIAGIYSLQNTVNGKQYIGSSQNIGNRFRQHRYMLKHDSHKNSHLQHSFNRHGIDNFEFKPLLICDVGNLEFYEQRCIIEFDTIRNGYNVRLEVATNRGVKFSAQACKNISDAVKGVKRGPSPLRGRPLSEAHRKKVGDAHRGMKRNADTRKNISAGIKKFYAENNDRAQELKLAASMRNKGRNLSYETKKKISKKLAGIKKDPFSKETKLKMSVNARNNPNHHKVAGWNKGLKMSQEFCDQMSRTRKGKPWSRARRAAQDAKKLITD